MAAAYQPDAWSGFYVAAAGVCAALWGLLFVAISLHPLRVGTHPVLRNRARVTLIGLCLLLVLSLVCLIPQQSSLALGAELALIWLLWLGTVTTGTIQLFGRVGQLEREYWVRTATAMVMGLFGLTAGVTLAWGQGGGLVWNVPASVLGLVLTLASAWGISFGPELQSDEPDPAATTATDVIMPKHVPAVEPASPVPD